MSSIAVLIGLVVGTAVAAAAGMVDFTGVHHAAWVGVTTPFRFGAPTFSVAAIASMIIVMLITAVETTGDVFATGEIVEKTVNQEDIARALRADGLSTLLGGILNSFPYTCFAESRPCPHRTEQQAPMKYPRTQSRVWRARNRCGTRVQPVSIDSLRKNSSHSIR
jgi:xanthine/uracil permease